MRGLDEILHGDIPEYSFNIIAGAPGCGKTTLAHQIAFANTSMARPTLYFTILGEPPLKMLRYQQQYTFFDQTKLGKSIRFINRSDVAAAKDLGVVLAEITEQVESTNPAIVIVDSFRSVLRRVMEGDTSEMQLQSFLQPLAMLMTSFQATTFLVGEYDESEIRENPVFTVADGLFWLTQIAERNSVVRKLQIIKLRGQGSVPGLHTIRIGNFGLQAFSRTLGLTTRREKWHGPKRLSTGIPDLDKLMGGGIRGGDSVLIAGPSGTGKSVIATQFIAAGCEKGEAGIIVVFEERPLEYAERAAKLGMDLKSPQEAGKLEILYQSA